MKKPVPSTHELHHLAVQKHFGCGPDAYQFAIDSDIPGMGVILEDVTYRVETIADRVELCRGEIKSIGDAILVPYPVAEWIFNDLEEHKDFFTTMLRVFEDDDEEGKRKKGRALERKVNMALALSIAQMTEQTLLSAFADVDEDLVAAAVVVAGRLDEGGRLPREMAAVYFRMGADVLNYAEGGLYAQVSVQETSAIIYEVDPDTFHSDPNAA